MTMEPRSKLCTAIRILLVIACLAGMSAPTWGQNFGSVVGTVTDFSGGVIPGASVTLINIGTNGRHAAVTDDAGTYRFVNLLPANYRLEVEASGFKRMTREPITVQVEAAVRADARLELGAINETVEVSSQSPLLQTETSSLSQVVEGQQVQEMPLNGRNIINLVALTPGVVQQGQSMGGAGLNKGTSTGQGGWGNLQIGGGIGNQNAFYIDGAPNNASHNSIMLVPTQDAIQEFRVASSVASVEYGRYGGGVVTMATKSGTNAFHGSAYEYLRNTVFNANNFFSNLNGAARPAWLQNQYGANIGGPIRKDRAFFFFSWEGLKLRLGNPTATNVPTAAIRAGLFNKKLTFPSAVSSSCYSYPTATSTQINPNCFDATAKYMMNTYYPLPNSSSSTNNYFVSPSVGDNQNQYNARIDYNISDSQHLFGRFAYWTVYDPAVQIFPTPAGAQDARNTAQQYVMGDTYTFNPSTVLDMRASVTNSSIANTPLTMGIDLSQFGAAYGALNSQVTYSANPGLTFSGSRGLRNISSGGIFSYPNVYDLTGNLTKIKGRHTLKFGGDFRLLDYNARATITSPSGTFSFDTSLTNDEFASFLLGIPTSGQIQTQTPVGAYTYYQGYYASDAWQISKNLTLNIGLRWELPGAMAERHDRAVVLLPDATDPVTGVKGTLALVNSSLYNPRTVVEPKYHLLSPRVGFAYRFSDQLVLRSGYGISYLPNGINSALAPYNQTIVNATTTWNNSVNSITHYLRDPFPQGILQPAGRTNPDFMKSLLGQNISAPIPDQPFPYVQQWNLSLGRQFAGNWMVEIGYVGSKSTHMPTNGSSGNIGKQGINQLSSQYYSLGSALMTTPAGSSMTLGQSLRPFPAYLNVFNAGGFVTVAAYHSMQVKMEKRFGTGGVLMTNYTWSKSMTSTEGQIALDSNIGVVQDFNNMRGEYSLTSFDVPHHLVVSYVLDLPFGRGKKFANWTGFAGGLVSGWAVNGITNLQSGFPIALSANQNNLTRYFGAGTIRPNRTANCDALISGSAQSRLSKWFNTACFAAPGSYSLGNEARTDPNVRSHGVNNFDASLLKTTRINESVSLQFRAEAFNLFNRVRFNPPAAVVDGANFGKVTSQYNQPRLLQFSLRLTF